MQGLGNRRRVGALAVGVTLLAAMAGTGTVSATTEPPEDTAAADASAAPGASEAPGGGEVVRCGFAPSDTTNGDIAGFGGTTPAGELTPEFFERLCGVDPELQDLNYAPESYDAVMIIALAVEEAMTDGIDYA